MSRYARVAVVGSGLSGLSCASRLLESGVETRLFDKGRLAGGRTATRAGDHGEFDYGAQYFTVNHPRFAAQVKLWEQAGVVARWRARLRAWEHGAWRPSSDATERWVGVPRMRQPALTLAAGLELEQWRRVSWIERERGAWTLGFETGGIEGGFDAVVVAVPAPQAVELLGPAPALAGRAARADFEPCWAVMARLEREPELDFDGAFVNDSALSWVCRNASKPGRGSHANWTLHAAPDWSRRRLGLGVEEVAAALLDELERLAGRLPPVVHAEAHLWRYSLPSQPLPERSLWDPELCLGACGDWCGGPRFEGAWLSGLELAERLLAS